MTLHTVPLQRIITHLTHHAAIFYNAYIAKCHTRDDLTHCAAMLFSAIRVMTRMLCL